MKKFSIAFTALAIIAFFSALASAIPPGRGGLVGLEITGNSGVGAVAYMGSSRTTTHTNSCFSNSKTKSVQEINGGVGIHSHAAGNVCMSSKGSTLGSVNGNGSFTSSVTGQLGSPGAGLNFSTSSVVRISGNNYSRP